jgi:hypothetical protein
MYSLLMSNADSVGIVILFTIAALIILDIFLYANDTRGDTISYVIKELSFGKYFFLTFA